VKSMATSTLLLALMTGHASGGESTAFAALRAKFPKGIPWKVEVLDPAGHRLASLQMRITSKLAGSCLGDIGADGVRVEFLRKDDVSPNLSLASYGVAKFTDDKVKIDLTGGICDAYSIMDGKIELDGSSTGTVFRLGMRGGDDIGTYRATIEPTPHR